MIVMSSVYLILGTFLFLIIILPSTNTIIAQTNYDCKMNQISTDGCKKVCDACAKFHDKDICDDCVNCNPGAPPFGS